MAKRDEPLIWFQVEPCQIGSKLTATTDEQPILLSLLTIEKVCYNMTKLLWLDGSSIQEVDFEFKNSPKLL